MSNITVGNIAVEAQRAIRLNSKNYGDRVLCLIDELVAENRLSRGGIKEMLRIREIFGGYFYYGNDAYVEGAMKCLMGFAFKERSGTVQ